MFSFNHLLQYEAHGFFSIRPILIIASPWETFGQSYTPSHHKTEVVFSKDRRCLRKNKVPTVFMFAIVKLVNDLTATELNENFQM